MKKNIKSVGASAISISLVGDSDIARWPSDLLPESGVGPCGLSGHSGSTLAEILPFCAEILDGALATSASEESTSTSTTDLTCVVVCAGENDIGNGLSLDEILASFEKLLNMVHTPYQYIIFLGPKIEPWLDDDPKSRKQYVKMSKAFRRAVERHPKKSQIRYIDCLTMFCGTSGNQPGAVFGGLARAEHQYFADDQLHLSYQGYQIWKQILEKQILSVTTKANSG